MCQTTKDILSMPHLRPSLWFICILREMLSFLKSSNVVLWWLALAFCPLPFSCSSTSFNTWVARGSGMKPRVTGPYLQGAHASCLGAEIHQRLSLWKASTAIPGLGKEISFT